MIKQEKLDKWYKSYGNEKRYLFLPFEIKDGKAKLIKNRVTSVDTKMVVEAVERKFYEEIPVPCTFLILENDNGVKIFSKRKKNWK